MDRLQSTGLGYWVWGEHRKCSDDEAQSASFHFPKILPVEFTLL